MHCFELRQNELLEGIPVTSGPEVPRVNVTGNGEYYFPLDDRLVRAVNMRVVKQLECRLKWARVSNDGECLTTVDKNDRVALVRLALRGGIGGQVTLTSCAYQEMVVNAGKPNEEVTKLFRGFPSAGVTIMGAQATCEDPTPWSVGCESLELAVAMIPGASFRIHLTGQIGRHQNVETFVRWRGHRLYVSPDTPAQREMKQKALGKKEKRESTSNELAAAAQ